jgi:diphthine methyl ester synthase
MTNSISIDLRLSIFPLCVVQVNEADYNSMSSGRLKYLPPRFMTINTAIEQLLEAENDKKEVTANT